jgi:hypothetical protein
MASAITDRSVCLGNMAVIEPARSAERINKKVGLHLESYHSMTPPDAVGALPGGI